MGEGEVGRRREEEEVGIVRVGEDEMRRRLWETERVGGEENRGEEMMEGPGDGRRRGCEEEKE